MAEGHESPTDRVQENPWIRSKVTTPTSSSVSFSDIIKDEQQKTETLAKTTKKPLSLIQVSLGLQCLVSVESAKVLNKEKF